MPTEMKTVQSQDTHPAEGAELDPNALSAIRDIINAQEGIAPPAPVAERAMRAAQTGGHSAAPAAPTPRPRPAFEPLAPVEEPTAQATPPKAAKPARDPLAGIKARVTGYRPTPKHILWALFALVVLFRPWLVVSLVLLGLFALTCTFLILGYDGFWTKAMGLARWYARRHPTRAEALHHKLDTFACRWDAFLDRFPEGTVDGLYLPDFGELAQADDRHAKALDRRLSQLEQRDA